jgi:hypothetical protein
MCVSRKPSLAEPSSTLDIMTPAASHWHTASAPATHAILYSFLPRFLVIATTKEAVSFLILDYQ